MNEDDRDAIGEVSAAWSESRLMSERTIAGDLKELLDASPAEWRRLIKNFSPTEVKILEDAAMPGSRMAPHFQRVARVIERLLGEE